MIHYNNNSHKIQLSLANIPLIQQEMFFWYATNSSRSSTRYSIMLTPMGQLSADPCYQCML